MNDNFKILKVNVEDKILSIKIRYTLLTLIRTALDDGDTVIVTFVVDGTFKSSPQGFYQIVVFHEHKFGQTFPYIYILLKGKSERPYSRVSDKCKELVTMNVENFVTDFERGLFNALRMSLPEANWNGCLLQLGQAACKRVGAMGDIEKFKNDSNYNLVFKRILRLAFVPIRDVSVETRNTNIALFISRILDCGEIELYNLKRYKKGLFESKKTQKAEDKIRIIVKNYKHYSREQYMNALLQHVNFKCE
ncbi:MULE domain-containing protein [Vairimorpha necatrix]|uniref:MULE domain-containing protein n=1 Tax=Vairimorpha necatrix TaxID=6039 RepID=A0AAX4J886_9MICR